MLARIQNDLEPLRTLESKRTLLREAVAGGWKFVFEHDPQVAVAVPVLEGKDVMLRDVIPAGSDGAPVATAHAGLP